MEAKPRDYQGAFHFDELISSKHKPIFHKTMQKAYLECSEYIFLGRVEEEFRFIMEKIIQKFHDKLNQKKN